MMAIFTQDCMGSGRFLHYISLHHFRVQWLAIMPMSKQRILLVDDDPSLRRLLARYLTQEGFEVIVASNGAEMRQQLAQQGVALILMDLILPDEDGFSLTRELQLHNPETALIMVTGKDDPLDKIVGLELGADDYLTKPFELRELLARIRAILRRRQKSFRQEIAPVAQVVAFRGWQFNLSSQELYDEQGQTVHLTSHELILLSLLVTHPKEILTRDQIMEAINGRSWQHEDRSIDVLVGKLRRKLQDDSRQPTLLRTIRGEGYMLIVEANTP